MRLLTGLIHPDAGTIELLGRPFGRHDRHRLYDVGALIESPSFYPFLSGRQNLRELAINGAPVGPGRIEELLELTGLRDRAADAVSTYSLGMKQRLGIAAALLSDPTLLLLDEPANGLDPAGIVAMRETLRHLAAMGKTVFVSSHLLAEMQQMADVVGIIAAGRLVREGPIHQLLNAEGTVRVRVASDEVAGATAATRRVLTGPGGVTSSVAEPGWLSVRVIPDRSGEVNRALAAAGIWATGLETGNDLEMLFLRADRRRSCGWRRGHLLRNGRHRPRVEHHRNRGRPMKLFQSGLRKLVRRQATWVTLGLLAGLLALIVVAVGATTGSRTGASATERCPRSVPPPAADRALGHGRCARNDSRIRSFGGDVRGHEGAIASQRVFGALRCAGTDTRSRCSSESSRSATSRPIRPPVGHRPRRSGFGR